MAGSRVTEPGIERSWPYRAAASLVVRPVGRLSRHDWQGLERLPEGPCLVAANHISNADPFALAHMLLAAGRSPFFLAKDSLFRLPFLGPWLAATGQIPVSRGTGRAVVAYTDALTALRMGRLVVVMPEGTLTRDPDGWPMRAKSGVVRLALATGAPVVPVGQWGAQQLLPPGARTPRLWPRPTMRLRVGDPVDLGDLSTTRPDRAHLDLAGERVMTAITDLVADLRGERPPAGRWDPVQRRRIDPRPEEHP